ncbi:cytochrome-c oxidase, cbb3-type subunit III [Pseudothioclava nitratireducens]|jgi:cytochrome c oxidase cbb3-type subunit 3|uniref:cytochrome-c oxidase, cbb3-type subunit III n=1 Tax=Pseudothioclava nitratireducens TaxID=1928646 RepID=UPI0023DB37E8|nr:cytochrome-c oxidase, cbb3-type subunit III [Defluviimonas nitratireducens]MDF1619069.1 cytochrome-c oxidase, cbb3-type subunit III [Defluviimonas nitratireducens]
MSKKPTKKQDVATTGHSWDGIEEYNNPLPKWWLYTFYACIVWGIGYTVAMPAWPLLNGATPGLLGASTRADVAAEIARYDAANEGVEAKLVAADLTEISADPELANFSQNAGAAVFRTWCAQCHGSGAGGQQSLGYPNLLDQDWLWGGSIEDIHFTVTHGIRNEDDPEGEARFSQMPAFGKDELLTDEEIAQVVQYVRKLSGQEFDSAGLGDGETLFIDNCASCHAEDGTGDRAQGAPNLTDAIWLYGGDVETLTETIYNARYGVMPNWNTRLSEAEIRAVAAYVHSLGGGE